MANTIDKKPNWLRKKINFNTHKDMEDMIGDSLYTVCQEALCPNITECFKNKNATFLIMGNICTRGCRFCNIIKGKPEHLDNQEPLKVAEAIKRLGLEYVVITSPTRDDIEDGGAQHYCDTIETIKELNPNIKIEILIPDMKGNENSLKQVSMCGADVIAHNMETVKRLYDIRKGADYERSLNLLSIVKQYNQNMITKSGIMLGFGEKDDEVKELFDDLLISKCDYLSIGQYLQPSPKYQDVVEYVKEEKFEYFKEIALNMGFESVQSSPYTRSSYLAHEYAKRV